MGCLLSRTHTLHSIVGGRDGVGDDLCMNDLCPSLCARVNSLSVSLTPRSDAVERRHTNNIDTQKDTHVHTQHRSVILGVIYPSIHHPSFMEALSSWVFVASAPPHPLPRHPPVAAACWHVLVLLAEPHPAAVTACLLCRLHSYPQTRQLHHTHRGKTPAVISTERGTGRNEIDKRPSKWLAVH